MNWKLLRYVNSTSVLFGKPLSYILDIDSKYYLWSDYLGKWIEDHWDVLSCSLDPLVAMSDLEALILFNLTNDRVIEISNNEK